MVSNLEQVWKKGGGPRHEEQDSTCLPAFAGIVRKLLGVNGYSPIRSGGFP